MHIALFLCHSVTSVCKGCTVRNVNTLQEAIGGASSKPCLCCSVELFHWQKKVTMCGWLSWVFWRNLSKSRTCIVWVTGNAECLRVPQFLEADNLIIGDRENDSERCSCCLKWLVASRDIVGCQPMKKKVYYMLVRNTNGSSHFWTLVKSFKRTIMTKCVDIDGQNNGL